jgi:hypothetical protein
VIGKVLDSEKNLALLHRHSDELDLVSDTGLSQELRVDLLALRKIAKSLGCDALSKEVLSGVISLHLDEPLLRRSLPVIIELEVVGGWDPHALAVSIRLIEELTHTLVVIAWWIPVLHQLDPSLLQGGATLGTIIGDCELTRSILE